MAQYFLIGKPQIELQLLMPKIYEGDSALGIAPFDPAILVGVSLVSDTQIRIDTEPPYELTSQQLADLQTLIDDHVYVDLQQARLDAIARQKQDDFFGLTRTEALQWIADQLETPTNDLSSAIDGISNIPTAKVVLENLRILQVRHNRAIKKIAEKLYDIVDMFDPTINKQE